jgi:hypothetical protein
LVPEAREKREIVKRFNISRLDDLWKAKKASL